MVACTSVARFNSLPSVYMAKFSISLAMFIRGSGLCACLYVAVVYVCHSSSCDTPLKAVFNAF